MLEGFTPYPREFAERYRAAGYWLDQPLGTYFHDRFVEYSERLAVVAGSQRITYTELDARIEHLARHLLDLGIAPLERVILQLPNVPEFLYLYFALQRVGAITLLALPPHRRYEIGHYAQFAEAVGYAAQDRAGEFSYVDMARDIQVETPSMRHIFVLGDEVPEGCHSIRDLLRSEPTAPAEALDEIVIDPEQPAVFQLSGGTTGVPKIIPRTHNDYVLNSVGCAGANYMDGEAKLLVCLPIAHNFPLASPGVQGVFVYGGTAVLAPTPRPSDILPLIENERISHLELVPAALIRLLHDETFTDFDTTSIRIVNAGGQRVQPEVAALAEQKFANGTMQEIFGMAEGLVMLNDIDDPPAVRFEVAGPPWCSLDEIKLIDDEGREVGEGESGEMACRGPYTLRGYYKLADHNARVFTADGFYLTGDLMRRHTDGRYVIEGRKKDLINRGGEKISAEEIENMLLAHPGVRNVACVPMPDPVLGERSCVYVIAATETPPTLDDLTAFLLDQDIAKFKLPERLELVEQFPLSPFGKVSKKDLAEMIAAKLAEEEHG